MRAQCEHRARKFWPHVHCLSPVPVVWWLICRVRCSLSHVLCGDCLGGSSQRQTRTETAAGHFALLPASVALPVLLRSASLSARLPDDFICHARHFAGGVALHRARGGEQRVAGRRHAEQNEWTLLQGTQTRLAVSTHHTATRARRNNATRRRARRWWTRKRSLVPYRPLLCCMCAAAAACLDVCRPHGEGEYMFRNGTVYSGNFTEGMFVGTAAHGAWEVLQRATVPIKVVCVD